jgi:DNA invertase Pin-like site-specific DNA recombinase
MLQPKPGDRCCSYIRCSTTEQSSDGYSVERQDSSLEGCERKLNIKIAKVFTDEGGKRWKLSSRPDFHKLWNEIAAGLWDWVIVDSQERYGTENAFQWGSFCDHLLRHGCNLWAIAESRCLTDPDDIGGVILGNVNAVLSSKHILDKSRSVMQAKHLMAKEDRYTGGLFPYAYDVAIFQGKTDQELWRIYLVSSVLGDYYTARNGKRRRKRVSTYRKIMPDGSYTEQPSFPAYEDHDTARWVITNDQDRLKVLALIFDLKSQGKADNKIARTLNEMGIPTMYGKVWNQSDIDNILTNPKYHGEKIYGRRCHSPFHDVVNGQVERVSKPQPRAAAEIVRHKVDCLIADAVWKDIQELKAEKRTVGIRGHNLWLKPFLYCADCKQQMRADRREQVYYCATHQDQSRAGLPTSCKRNSLRHAKAEELVLRYLADVGKDIEALTSPIQPLPESANNPKRERLWQLIERMHEFMGRHCDGNMVNDYLAFVETRQRKGETGCKPPGLDLYEFVFARKQTRLTAELDQKEAEHADMVAGFLKLTSPLAIQKANEMMGSLEAEITQLREEVQPIHHEQEALLSEIERMKIAAEELHRQMTQDDGQRKAAALRNVVDQVVCTFRDNPLARKKHTGRMSRSRLVEVAVLPRKGGRVATYDLSGIHCVTLT